MIVFRLAGIFLVSFVVGWFYCVILDGMRRYVK